MNAILKHKFLIGATTLAAAASAGGAYAATHASPTSRQAFLNDVAKRLNVTPGQLNTALKAAITDRLDAAVKAGELTQAQADRIKARIAQGGRMPFLLGPRALGGRPDALAPRALPERPPGRFGALAASARYLGLTDAQLFGELRSGKSLAQVAHARGKSVSGLEQAILGAMTARLDRAVADGLITKAQEQRLLTRLSRRIDRRVNRPGLRSAARPGPPMSSSDAPPLPPPPPPGSPAPPAA
jgi:ribosomal protein S20